MTRGTKDRPPQIGSLKTGVTAGIEKSLTNIGGKAVDCWSGVNAKEKHKVQKGKRQKNLEQKKKRFIEKEQEKQKNEFHCKSNGKI